MKPEQRQQAQDLYLQSDFTQQQIADILKVDRRSVGRWMKEGHWDSLKMSARIMPMQLSHNIYSHIEAVEQKIQERAPEDRCPTMMEIEMLRKLYNMLSKIPERYSSGSYTQAYAHLMQELGRKNALEEKEYETVRRTAQNIIAAYCEDIKWKTDGEWVRLRENIIRIEAEQAESEAQQTPQQQEKNVASGAFPGDNGTFAKNDIHPSKPAPVASNDHPANAKEPSECPISDFPGSGTSEPGSASGSDGEPRLYPIPGFTDDEIFKMQVNDERYSLPRLKRLAALPPHQRPSPFKIGNIIWVNNIDDVDKQLDNFGQEWGEQKMGNQIRRYAELK